ncbi:MAG: YlmC/YmxH family sporulation protein [Anaerovorax sp.]
MRLSEIGYKEIINLSTGSRHGQLSSAELLFEESSGKITAILVPSMQGRFGFMGSKEFLQLPWESIIKIGDDIIIFETA